MGTRQAMWIASADERPRPRHVDAWLDRLNALAENGPRQTIGDTRTDLARCVRDLGTLIGDARVVGKQAGRAQHRDDQLLMPVALDKARHRGPPAAIGYRCLFEHERLKRGSSDSPEYRAEAFARVHQSSSIDARYFHALRSVLDPGQFTRCAPCGTDDVILFVLSDAHRAPERERSPQTRQPSRPSRRTKRPPKTSRRIEQSPRARPAACRPGSCLRHLVLGLDTPAVSRQGRSRDC